MMMYWIGAVYYRVDITHPISNGVRETFSLQDEYYFNFFTEADGRNPGSDRVTILHSAKAPSHSTDMNNQANWRDQAVYWSFTRENGGRSVAMTSAHFYHIWANRHFFQSVANSVFWTLNLEVPKDGGGASFSKAPSTRPIGASVKLTQTLEPLRRVLAKSAGKGAEE